MDRDGERLALGCFTPLPPRLPWYSDHKHDSEHMVGSGRPFFVGDVLRLEGKFASTGHAQTVRRLVAEQHLTGMSVGFARTKRENRKGTTWVTKGELVEASFTGPPANTDARIVAVRGVATTIDEDEERELRRRALHMVRMAEKIAEDVSLTPKWCGLRKMFRDDEGALAAIDALERYEQLELERMRLELY